MPSRPSKKGATPSTDPNISALNAVRKLTGQDAPQDDIAAQRSQAARMLGLLGGSKGGKKRAANLTKKERSEIAKMGAKARWKGHKPKKAD
jgi:hypothetical protein